MEEGRTTHEEIARDKGEFISTSSHLRRGRRAPGNISCIETLSFLFSLRRERRAQRGSIRRKRFSVVCDRVRAACDVVFRRRHYFRRYFELARSSSFNRERERRIFRATSILQALRTSSRVIDIEGMCVIVIDRKREREKREREGSAISDPRFVRGGGYGGDGGESKISISRR